MTKNKIKTQNTSSKTADTNEKSSSKSSVPKGLVIKMLYKIFGGQYLENVTVLNQFPYFIFLIFIGLLYITNTNIADKKIRDINKLNKELKELRSEYIITKSELMFLSKQSELAKRVEPLGLKETTQQPYLIIAEDTTLKIY